VRISRCMSRKCHWNCHWNYHSPAVRFDNPYCFISRSTGQGRPRRLMRVVIHASPDVLSAGGGGSAQGWVVRLCCVSDSGQVRKVGRTYFCAPPAPYCSWLVQTSKAARPHRGTLRPLEASHPRRSCSLHHLFKTSKESTSTVNGYPSVFQIQTRH
jgi:hypothetical protein